MKKIKNTTLSEHFQNQIDKIYTIKSAIKKMQISNLVRSKVCEQRILVCCKSLRSDKYWLCSEC